VKQRRHGERQHNIQSANKRQTGGEAPVDKRQRGVKRQRLHVKRRRRRVKRRRGGGINMTTSRQTRGKQEMNASQKLAGLLKGQEAMAAARREALQQPAREQEAKGGGGASRQEAMASRKPGVPRYDKRQRFAAGGHEKEEARCKEERKRWRWSHKTQQPASAN